MKKNGFTLIELLISIFIFSIILLMGASSLATSFVSGRLYSNSSKDINRDVTSIFETIQSKVLTSQRGTIGGQDVYGFRVDGPVLAIKGKTDCTFFYFSAANKAIYAKNDNSCAAWYSSDKALINITDRLTSKNLTITAFDLTASNEYDPANKSAPYLTVKITAKDTKNNATADFVNTFTLPYAVLKTF